MATKSLTLNERVHVTGVLLAPEGEPRRRLGSNALLVPLLPLLQAAHAAVRDVLPAPKDPRRQALAAAAAAVDAVRDALAGNVHQLLSALARLSDDGGRYLALRDALLPDGVAGATHITDEGEAGFAARLRAPLTEAQRKELATISVGPRTLLEVITEWMDAGERRGRVKAA